MTQREQNLKRIFIGALAVGLVLYLWPAVDRMLFQEIRDRSDEIATLESDVAKAETAKRFTQVDESRTVLWKALSLPPDPASAQRQYLEWLTDLVTELGFEGPPSLQPGQRIPHRGVYTTVVVNIEAEATFETVTRFLFHAQRTNLMHRIASLDLVRTGSSPSDPLKVTMAAEGFSFSQALPRERLLPRTTLDADVGRDDETLTVAATDGFPSGPLSKPFEVRLGGEFARVTAVKGATWTLERGQHDSRAASHDRGDEIELVRVADAWRNVTLEDYREFVESNPFAKPRSYSPSVSPIRDLSVKHGETANTRVVANGYDPARGEPTFELVERADEGMTLDADSGEFAWTPGEDVALGEYEATVRVTFPGHDEPIERSFSVTVREANEPPLVAELEDGEVTQGGTIAFTAAATDPEETAVRYGLRDAPRGASIDEETGEFTWNVDIEFDPGRAEFEITATDEGGATGSRAVRIDVIENTARHTFLVGVYDRDGDREAWLFDRSNSTKSTLREGTWATVGGIESFILVIGRDFVLMQQEETTVRLDLGRSLAELAPQTDDESG